MQVFKKFNLELARWKIKQQEGLGLHIYMRGNHYHDYENWQKFNSFLLAKIQASVYKQVHWQILWFIGGMYMYHMHICTIYVPSKIYIIIILLTGLIQKPSQHSTVWLWVWSSPRLNPPVPPRSQNSPHRVKVQMIVDTRTQTSRWN